MRYIVNSNGYVTSVSFGANITCGDNSCTEYTGSVPADYKSLEDWYLQESEKLYRWKIIEGELTLDSSAVPPADAEPAAVVMGFRRGVVSITPSAANTPTVKAVSWEATEQVPTVVATAGSQAIGVQVTGVGVNNLTTTGCQVWLTRTNTTATNIFYIAGGF